MGGGGGGGGGGMAKAKALKKSSKSFEKYTKSALPSAQKISHLRRRWIIVFKESKSYHSAKPRS